VVVHLIQLDVQKLTDKPNYKHFAQKQIILLA